MVRACLAFVVFVLGCGDPSTDAGELAYEGDPALGEWHRTWPGRYEAVAERWFRLDADGMGTHSHQDGGLLEGAVYWQRREGEYLLSLYCDTIDGDPEPCMAVWSLDLTCRYDSSTDTLTCAATEAPDVEATYTRLTPQA